MKRANKKDRNNREEKTQMTVSLREVCPDSVKVPLRYSYRASYSGAVAANQIFNLNSLFDPDRTGVGHQPLGFDQWSAFYNRYRVDKVHVEIDFTNATTVFTDCLVVASNDSTPITTATLFASAAEAPFSWNKMMAMSPSVGQVRYSRTFDLAAIAGATKAKYRIDDSYQAVTTASPTEALVLHVAMQDIGFTTNIATGLRVRLTYFTEFWDRNQLTQS